MNTSWVLGAGGLLGQSIVEESSKSLWTSNQKQISWEKQEVALAQIQATARQFFSECIAKEWKIYWCAGRGTVLGGIQQMELERTYLSALLNEIEQQPFEVRCRGMFVFASSAGAIYGGGRDGHYTETSQVAPYGAYGEHKVLCEQAISRFAISARCRVAICRISNLYGPGQDLTKGQGLISVLALSFVRHVPAPIYVPLDTVRNFIYVDDAARIMCNVADDLMAQVPGTIMTKNICSSRNLSIAQLLLEFSRVFGRRPQIVGRSPRSGLQSPRMISVRSVVHRQLDLFPHTPIEVGLNAIRQDSFRLA